MGQRISTTPKASAMLASEPSAPASRKVTADTQVKLKALSPSARAFIAELEGRIENAGLKYVYDFLPPVSEMHFSVGTADESTYPVRLRIGTRNGDGIFVYLPHDFRDEITRGNLAMRQETNLGEVIEADKVWGSKVQDFDAVAPFCYMKQSGTGISSQRSFYAMVLWYYFRAGFDEKGVDSETWKEEFLGALKDMNLNADWNKKWLDIHSPARPPVLQGSRKRPTQSALPDKRESKRSRPTTTTSLPSSSVCADTTNDMITKAAQNAGSSERPDVQFLLYKRARGFDELRPTPADVLHSPAQRTQQITHTATELEQPAKEHQQKTPRASYTGRKLDFPPFLESNHQSPYELLARQLQNKEIGFGGLAPDLQKVGREFSKPTQGPMGQACSQDHKPLSVARLPQTSKAQIRRPREHIRHSEREGLGEPPQGRGISAHYRSTSIQRDLDDFNYFSGNMGNPDFPRRDREGSQGGGDSSHNMDGAQDRGKARSRTHHPSNQQGKVQQSYSRGGSYVLQRKNRDNPLTLSREGRSKKRTFRELIEEDNLLRDSEVPEQQLFRPVREEDASLFFERTPSEEAEDAKKQAKYAKRQKIMAEPGHTNPFLKQIAPAEQRPKAQRAAELQDAPGLQDDPNPPKASEPQGVSKPSIDDDELNKHKPRDPPIHNAPEGSRVAEVANPEEKATPMSEQPKPHLEGAFHSNQVGKNVHDVKEYCKPLEKPALEPKAELDSLEEMYVERNRIAREVGKLNDRLEDLRQGDETDEAIELQMAKLLKQLRDWEDRIEEEKMRSRTEMLKVNLGLG